MSGRAGDGAFARPFHWKKLTSHPAYRGHRHECRMQCPSFRGKHIDAAVNTAPG